MVFVALIGHGQWDGRSAKFNMPGPDMGPEDFDALLKKLPTKQIVFVNTDRPAQRSNVQVQGGKTGYNDDARYCLVIATKIDGRSYFMSFLGNEGKLTRFGDVARVADWVVSHKPKTVTAAAPAQASTPAVAATPTPTPTPTVAGPLPAQPAQAANANP